MVARAVRRVRASGEKERAFSAALARAWLAVRQARWWQRSQRVPRRRAGRSPSATVQARGAREDGGGHGRCDFGVGGGVPVGRSNRFRLPETGGGWVRVPRPRIIFCGHEGGFAPAPPKVPRAPPTCRRKSFPQGHAAPQRPGRTGGVLRNYKSAILEARREPLEEAPGKTLTVLERWAFLAKALDERVHRR
jgi:hypothetical protein